MSEKIQREQVFHDQRFANDAERRKKVGKFYRITETIQQRYRQALLSHSSGSRFLEYGCGMSSMAFELATYGARVTAIDISQVALDIAQQRAKAQGLDAHMHFLLMNAEMLALPDNSFDVVYGSGILHHLDLNLALSEIRRVLRPHGKAIFIEPLGNNIFINAYRAATPTIRTVDEHPITTSDIHAFHTMFPHVQIHYFYWLALAAVPFMRFQRADIVLSLLEKVDTALFHMPLLNLKSQAWMVLIELRNV